MPIAKRATSIRPSVPVAATRSGRIHLLDIPFAHKGFAATLDARWDEDAKAFKFIGDHLPEGLHAYRALPYSWEAYQEGLLNDDDPEPSEPQRRIELRPHQKEAVRATLRAREHGHPGFLIADEVGLGKTIEAWQAVLEMDDGVILIVGPLSALANWRRTVQWMGDGGKTVVIINYEKLKKVFDVPKTIPTTSRKKKVKKRKVSSQKGIARYGKVIAFDLVIWDEAHKKRIPTSARSGLARRVDAEVDFIMDLSATAGQDPIELSYLAPMLASRTGAGKSELADYDQWCQSIGIGVRKAGFGKMAWVGRPPTDATPEQIEAARRAHAHDLPLMNDLLYGGDVPIGIRRRPEDIAGWPSMERVILPVQLDGADREAYETAWHQFRDEMGLSYGTNSKNKLVQQLRFRQKISLLRTGQTVDMAIDLVESGQQVAISVQFLESMAIMRDALKSHGFDVAEISGPMHGNAREENRLRFQRDQAQVILYTVVDAINLHQQEMPEGAKPRSNVIHDIRWSGIEMHQIAGRTHRDGRFSRAYWMTAEDTVDEVIANVVAGRLSSMAAMQGDEDTVAEIEAMLRKPG